MQKQLAAGGASALSASALSASALTRSASMRSASALSRAKPSCLGATSRGQNLFLFQWVLQHVFHFKHYANI